MLWGRARAAMRQLHPLHRSLVQDHKVAATLTPAGWQQLIAALGTHQTVLPQRKFALPERVWTTFVPLLQVISQDVDPDGTIEVALDLTGPDAPGKAGPLAQVRPGVGERYQVDPWLRIRADLRDGSRLLLLLTTRVRLRTITRRNPRGKVKRKQRRRAGPDDHGHPAAPGRIPPQPPGDPAAGLDPGGDPDRAQGGAAGGRETAATPRSGGGSGGARGDVRTVPVDAAGTGSGRPEGGMTGTGGSVPPYGMPPGGPGYGMPPGGPGYGMPPGGPGYGMPPGGPGFGAPPPASGRSARRCAVTTGFFVLQPCGAAMVSACLQCGRPVCLAHVQPGGWCSECAAAQDASADHPLHPLWAQRQRRRTYASVADEYQDLTWYSAFDALDRASFDPQSDAGADPYAGGFDVDGDGDVDADDDRDGDGDIDADDLDYGTDS